MSQKKFPPQYSHEKILEILMKFRAPLIIALITIMLSTVSYMLVSHVSVLKALYMTVLTVTTIGYGEMWDMSSKDRIVNLLVMTVGVGAVMGYSLAVLIDLITSGELLRILRFRKMVGDISLLKGHYLVFGLNHYVEGIVKELKANKIPVVLISESDDLEKFAERLGLKYFLNLDVSDSNALYLANIHNAVGAIVATESDYKNLAVVLTVKSVVSKEHIYPFFLISVSQSQTFAEKLKLVGADYVEVIPSLVSKRIATLARKPPIFGERSLLEEMFFGEQTLIDIEEFVVQPDSPLLGKTLGEIDLRRKFGITVIAIKKKDGRLIYTPGKDEVIEALDILVVVAPKRKLKKISEILSQGKLTSRGIFLKKKLKERLRG